MATVLLLHSSLGLRPSVLRAAARWRQAGHEVVAPDLFDGRTFDGPEAGVAHVQAEIGWAALHDRVVAAAPAGPLAVVGLSLGGLSAVRLAVSRPDVRGVLLLHGALSPEGEWPAGVPVEAHYAVDDPWNDEGEPEGMLGRLARAGAPASAHAYPGSGHLFTDEDSPEHDPVASALLWARADAFLARLDEAEPQRPGSA